MGSTRHQETVNRSVYTGTGQRALILHLMSTFPPLSETFIMREVRQLRTEGWDVRIGMLRPLNNNLSAQGFDDLAPFVSQATWVSFDLIIGIVYFVALFPTRVSRCLATILRSFSSPRWIPKMLYTLSSSMRLAYRFRGYPPALVRASFLHTEALAASFIGVLLGVPYSVTVYTVAAFYPRAVIQSILNRAQFLIADTKQVCEYLSSLGATPGCLAVVHNSINIGEFPARSPRASMDPPLVLGVGRLDPKKGFDVLLSACAVLRDRGVKFHCAIAGEGSERETLECMRVNLALEGYVTLLGKLYFDEIRNWYYRADVFAMPSIVTSTGDSDGLPTVVVEAMASGLPVVGSTTGGIPEAVHDGKNGFLVPPNDPIALANRVQMLIQRQELRQQMGRNGRRIAETEFDLARKGEKLSSLIEGYLRYAWRE